MIPDTVEKCDVYFSRFSNLTEITIPGSVKKFGGNFQNMDKLETITFEEGVQEIPVTLWSQIVLLWRPLIFRKV